MSTVTKTTLLFAGEILDGRDDAHLRVTDLSGQAHTVRVRLMPVRHHLDMVDLFDLGRQADLIQKCTQRAVFDDAGGITEWASVDITWIDNLDDASTVRLAEIAAQLNFTRVISTAEREITSAQTLRPLKTRVAEQMIAPSLDILNRQFTSWTSSLTQALSSVFPEKKS